MSRSKKWRLEWAFFLGENGRRQYNKLCKGCVHPCKQSFRAVVMSCPHYLSLRSKKCGNQGSKQAKKPPVAAFSCRGSMISHVGRQGVSTQEKRRIFTFRLKGSAAIGSKWSGGGAPFFYSSIGIAIVRLAIWLWAMRNSSLNCCTSMALSLFQKSINFVLSKNCRWSINHFLHFSRSFS